MVEWTSKGNVSKFMANLSNSETLVTFDIQIVNLSRTSVIYNWTQTRMNRVCKQRTFPKNTTTKDHVELHYSAS